MFNKFKLVGTAIGLVTVLILLLVLTGTGEQPSGGPPSRADIKKGLDNAFAAVLTASGENILLDSERAVFLSEFRETLAFVPLHDTYRPRARELMEARVKLGEDVLVPIGGLYIEESTRVKGFSEFLLPPGAYILMWANNRKVAVIDQDGDTVGYISGEIQLPITKDKPTRPLILNSSQNEDFLQLSIYVPWLTTTSLQNQSESVLDTTAGPIADFVTGFMLVLTIVMMF